MDRLPNLELILDISELTLVVNSISTNLLNINQSLGVGIAIGSYAQRIYICACKIQARGVTRSQC